MASKQAEELAQKNLRQVEAALGNLQEQSSLGFNTRIYIGDEVTHYVTQLPIQWLHLDRFGNVAWHHVALWLYMARMLWFEDNYVLLMQDGLMAVVRSESIQLDTSSLHPGTTVRIISEFGRCKDSQFEMCSTIYAEKKGAFKEIGTAVVAMACITRENGVPRKAPAPKSLQLLSRELVAPEFRLLEDAFRAQRLQRDVKPTWVYPLFIRYTDEDTNLHINHASYFRFFSDAKLFAIRRGLANKSLGAAITSEEPPAEIIELCHLEPTSFFVFFAREVRLQDHINYYIVVQADKKQKMLEFFLCSKENDNERVHTLGRMEVGPALAETSKL